MILQAEAVLCVSMTIFLRLNLAFSVGALRLASARKRTAAQLASCFMRQSKRYHCPLCHQSYSPYSPVGILVRCSLLLVSKPHRLLSVHRRFRIPTSPSRLFVDASVTTFYSLLLAYTQVGSGCANVFRALLPESFFDSLLGWFERSSFPRV